MGFFRTTRYTFSERLRRRERNRQRLRLLSLVLCALSGYAVLQPSTTEEVAASASKPAAPLRRQAPAAQASAQGVELDTRRGLLSMAASQIEASMKQHMMPTVARKLVRSVSEMEVLQALSDRRSVPPVTQLSSGDRVEFSIQEELQAEADAILAKYKVPYGAIVAVEPKSGKILALAGASSASRDADSFRFALQSGMPAASLIKVVSAAAAIERGGAHPNDVIQFRGGTYTLNKWNYKPDSRRDTRRMSIERALATSCNPVFGRLGLQVTGADLLSKYAESFGFNREIPFALPLERSEFAEILDDYSLARTAAGFGDVTISPLHAAMLMAAIANGGEMMKPQLLERVELPNGIDFHLFRPEPLLKVTTASTANVLMDMMVETMTSGTGRRHFSAQRAPKLRGIQIAGKTGTLSGTTPAGRYHWLIAAAPVENPEIAIAALVVDTGNARINGTGIGRLFLEKFFEHKARRSGREV